MDRDTSSCRPSLSKLSEGAGPQKDQTETLPASTGTIIAFPSSTPVLAVLGVQALLSVPTDGPPSEGDSLKPLTAFMASHAQGTRLLSLRSPLESAIHLTTRVFSLRKTYRLSKGTVYAHEA
jgi:hypothetical protein